LPEIDDNQGRRKEIMSNQYNDIRDAFNPAYDLVKTVRVGTETIEVYHVYEPDFGIEHMHSYNQIFLICRKGNKNLLNWNSPFYRCPSTTDIEQFLERSKRG
jgi:hypothetical protein